MNLYALDKSYSISGILASNNIQWTRRYYKCGEFSIQIPKEDYDPNMTYVYIPERKELGVISKIVQNEEYKSNYIQLSGFFAENELNDKIVYPTFFAQGNIETKILEMVNRYKDDIPNLVTGANNNMGQNIEFQETGGELGNVAYTRLESQELSQKIEFDFLAGKKTYKVWQGKDRTQSQKTNEPVLFSSDMETLKKSIVVDDWTKQKNYAVIGGSGQGADRIYTNVDLSNGGYKREVFINGSSVQYDEKKQTMNEYINNLKQYGLEQMLKHQRIQNVDAYADANSYEYLKDYDLGDKCNVRVDSLQLMLEARIISIYEVWKDNKHTVELEFGNQKII